MTQISNPILSKQDPVTKVRHNRQESRRIEDWIFSQWERIEKERPTRDELASQASKALNLKMTRSIISSATEAIGKEYPQLKRRGQTVRTMNGTTRKRWRIVVHALMNLYQKVGEAVPNELVEFREELSNEEIISK